MGKINLLSEEVANLIAAGEVVDRPASVLKELLENAIDAGATAITAEVRGGGVSLIRVTDNGSGIAPEDLPVALQRHATSKIRTAADLDEILTLGFRGEALAAIAGVSKLEILTKQPAAPCGTLLTAEYGRITGVEEIGCADGTTLLVRELFGNVPARRKFLKKDVTEASGAVAYAEKIAISHPEIAFTMLVDGVTRFSTVGDGNLLGVLYAIEGRAYAGKMLAVSGKLPGMTVEGYVGRSDCVLGNRNHQNTFINGRFVRSKTMTAALEKAFTSYIAPGKFPVCALFLTISPGFADVNVHPAKLEVRFADERPIFELVYHAVRGALAEAAYRPELETAAAKAPVSFPSAGTPPAATPPPAPSTKPASPVTEAAPSATPPASATAPAPAPKQPPVAPPRAETPQAPASARGWDYGDLFPGRRREVCRGVASEPQRMIYNNEKTSEAPRRVSGTPLTVKAPPEPLRPLERAGKPAAPAPTCPPPSEPAPPFAPTTLERESQLALAADPSSYTVIGEAFHTYVLVELADSLMLIDKHAAHERILYEQLRAEMEASGRTASQGLLLPVEVALGSEECAAAESYRAELSAFGFTFTIDVGIASLTEIPAAIAPDAAGELFRDLLGDPAAEGQDIEAAMTARRERALYGIACKAAIKGGRDYDRAHIDWLVGEVMRRPDITVCPHGRPIAMTLTKKHLDREFNRIQH